MVWTRTPSGLRNFSKFTRKKYTVYCEGGDLSLDVAAVLNGGGSEATEDATFWRAVFNAAKKEAHIKSIGNNKSVDEMADIIIANDIPYSIACRDRDWTLVSERKNDKRVIYTHGYSWENDIAHNTTVASAFCDLSLQPPAAARSIIAGFNQLLADIDRNCRWPLHLQYQSRDCGYIAVPTNQTLGGIIKSNSILGVYLDMPAWRKQLKANKDKFTKSGVGKNLLKFHDGIFQGMR